MKHIDDMRYQLVPDEDGHSPIWKASDDSYGVSYREMVRAVRRDDIREWIESIQCDTPIRYLYEGRTGYLSVPDFLVRGKQVHYALIEEQDMSYFVHPDVADMVVSIHNAQMRERGMEGSVTATNVKIPQIQIDINTEEFYVW